LAGAQILQAEEALVELDFDGLGIGLGERPRDSICSVLVATYMKGAYLSLLGSLSVYSLL